MLRGQLSKSSYEPDYKLNSPVWKQKLASTLKLVLTFTYSNLCLSVFMNSVVGLEIRYSLDFSGFEPGWWQKIFSSPHASWTALGPTQPSVRGVPMLFREGKVEGVWCWTLPPSPPSSAEVKERVQLHLYSALCLHCQLREELYFYLIINMQNSFSLYFTSFFLLKFNDAATVYYDRDGTTGGLRETIVGMGKQ